MIRERMGRLLLEAQLVSEGQIQEALEVQRSSGSRLGSILVEMGAVSETTLLEFLSQQYGVPTVELSGSQVEEEVLNLVPFEVAQKYMVVPVRKTHSRLALAMVDPSNMAVIDEMKFRTGTARGADDCDGVRYGDNDPSMVSDKRMVIVLLRSWAKGLWESHRIFLTKVLIQESQLSFQDPSLGELGQSEGFDDLQSCLREALAGLPRRRRASGWPRSSGG